MAKRICAWIGALCLGSMGLAGTARADDSPYDAYVVVEQADVVAGPGHRYYVTGRLEFGAKVEIYREEAGGWLAIRPPEGSFSWVPGEFVETLEEDKGRVLEPTGAWVGTAVEHVEQHQQHVTLKSGELVTILGEKAVKTASGERMWLKIAPPAGEYRWVYLRDVSRQRPEARPATRLAAGEEISQDGGEEAGEPGRLELSGQPIALSSLDRPGAGRDGRIALAQFRSGTSSSPSAGSSPDGFVPRKRREGASEAGLHAAAGARAARPGFLRPPAASGAAPDRTAAAAAAGQAAPATIRHALPAETGASGLAPAEVERQLDQIEIELSLMIAQDRSQWRLGPLKQRVETLIANGADPAARGRARLALDKIKQFETAFQASSEPAAPRGAAVTAKELADPRYDAQGVLKEVISRKGGKPAAPFAVVDGEGKPLCFVSPSPGLNLNRYVNKPVGLYGRRGYLEELKKPHVVAENVIELDTRLR